MVETQLLITLQAAWYIRHVRSLDVLVPYLVRIYNIVLLSFTKIVRAC